MKCQGWETRYHHNKMKEIKMNCIGIDVSRQELVVVVSVKGKVRKAKVLYIKDLSKNIYIFNQND